MNQRRCRNCEAKQTREILARILMKSVHLQGERQIDPPLRDRYNRYSVTGIAADTLTPGMWVWTDGLWRYFHPEWFSDWDLISPQGTNWDLIPLPGEDWDLIPLPGAGQEGPLTSMTEARYFRREWRVDREKLQELEEHAGPGIISACPEEIFYVLGVNTDLNQLRLEIRKEGLNKEQTRLIDRNTKYLDELDFPAAARLLREVPELLDKCRCNEPEDSTSGLKL